MFTQPADAIKRETERKTWRFVESESKKSKTKKINRNEGELIHYIMVSN
jgi:hypothetical protein